jgi:hypothetical protein
MTPSGIDPATFRFVVQCLNHCATACPEHFNFERVHSVVFILMYWIYLLPSTQQKICYNGFITTCFDSHESSSGYVQNLSVLAVLLLVRVETCRCKTVITNCLLCWR